MKLIFKLATKNVDSNSYLRVIGKIGKLISVLVKEMPQMHRVPQTELSEKDDFYLKFFYYKLLKVQKMSIVC